MRNGTEDVGVGEHLLVQRLNNEREVKGEGHSSRDCRQGTQLVSLDARGCVNPQRMQAQSSPWCISPARACHLPRSTAPDRWGSAATAVIIDTQTRMPAGATEAGGPTASWCTCPPLLPLSPVTPVLRATFGLKPPSESEFSRLTESVEPRLFAPPNTKPFSCRNCSTPNESEGSSSMPGGAAPCL